MLCLQQTMCNLCTCVLKLYSVVRNCINLQCLVLSTMPYVTVLITLLRVIVLKCNIIVYVW